MKHVAANIFLGCFTMVVGLVTSTGPLGQGVCSEPACQVTQNMSAAVQAQVNREFLGRYIGTAENTTLGKRGDMSIEIKQSDREGEFRVSIKASEGLPGEGALIGEISPNGELRAYGMFRFCTLLGGCSGWYCKLTGFIRENRLKGNYSLFPKTQLPIINDMPKIEASESVFDLQKYVPAFTPR